MRYFRKRGDERRKKKEERRRQKLNTNANTIYMKRLQNG